MKEHRHPRERTIDRRGRAAVRGADTLRKCLESASFAGLADLYAPQAVLDANVPLWRFQRRGPDEIIRQFQEWYPTPVRVVSWRERPTEGGVVVEFEGWQGEGEDEVYSRAVDIILTDGERITEHHHVLHRRVGRRDGRAPQGRGADDAVVDALRARGGRMSLFIHPSSGDAVGMGAHADATPPMMGPGGPTRRCGGAAG